MSDWTPGAKARRFLGAVGTPLAYSVGAVIVGLGLPRLEAAFLPALSAQIGAGTAIALLSAIAAGMLPLTGLVFSLAFVMVQFSATAYSPRLVAWLAGSALMRHSLGAFTATFLYAVAALGWVDRGGSGKVPRLTVWFAIALLLVSVVFFVLLVERLTMLQISHVLAYAGDQGRAVIERDYAPLGEGGAERIGAAPDELPAERQVVLHRGGPAVIQAIDVPRLVALAQRERVVVALAWAVGDTVVDGMPLLSAHSGGRPVLERRLRRLVRLGSERTFEQDPKYAIRILVDIAIKALSPAINDPTTAVQALDQVEDLLLRLGRADLETGRARDGRRSGATSGGWTKASAARSRTATTGRTRSRSTARGSACRGSGRRRERGQQGSGDARPRRPDRARSGSLPSRNRSAKPGSADQPRDRLPGTRDEDLFPGLDTASRRDRWVLASCTLTSVMGAQ
jgi:hypothetical protein